MKQIAIVGAGFSGAVVANRLAETSKARIHVFEAREHLAGNCHTERDPDSGVMVHVYGPHIFHTSNKEVWDYVNAFGRFRTYENRVKAVTERGVFTLPINLLTINQFFNQNFSPSEAEKFIRSIGKRYPETPKTFEEQALAFLGEELYRNFFLGYTKKQWGVDPSELPAYILKRLPVRFNYNDNYFNDLYQGIPEDGYTKIVERMLDHTTISLHLGTRFRLEDIDRFDHVVYTGPIDSLFNKCLGALRYRTLDFEVIKSEGDFQGTAVMNYCHQSVPYTRITEHKHFAPWETHSSTIVYREFSRACTEFDVPYYPLGLESDIKLFDSYNSLGCSLKNVTFLGRLATYRYLDMHVVIHEALNASKVLIDHCL